MGRFSITSLLNEQPSQSDSAKNPWEIKLIPYYDIDPNPENKYSLAEEDQFDHPKNQLLAATILEFGVMDPCIIKPTDNNRYMMVSGHRRRMITKALFERGELDSPDLPCLLIDPDEHPAISDLKLHFANLPSRDLTEYDKLLAIEDLAAAIERARVDGVSVKGTTREIIATGMGMKPTQTQKYMTFSKQGDKGTREALQNKEITFEEAYKKTRSPADPAKRTTTTDRKHQKAKSRPPVNSADNLMTSFGEFKKLCRELNDPELELYLLRVEEKLNKIKAERDREL